MSKTKPDWADKAAGRVVSDGFYHLSRTEQIKAVARALRRARATRRTVVTCKLSNDLLRGWFVGSHDQDK